MKRLNDIEERINAAYPGPWTHINQGCTTMPMVRTVEGYDISMIQGFGDCDTFMEPENAEFIAHARQDVPALVEALRAVLEIHAEKSYGCAVCEEQDQALPWPCPTVTAIHQHLGDTE